MYFGGKSLVREFLEEIRRSDRDCVTETTRVNNTVEAVGIKERIQCNILCTFSICVSSVVVSLRGQLHTNQGDYKMFELVSPNNARSL